MQNLISSLVAKVQTLNLPLLLVAGVLCIIAWIVFKKALAAMSRAQRSKITPASFPGEEVSFHAAFEESTFGAVLLDREGRVLHANRALQNMLGYDFTELANHPLTNYVHPEDAHTDKSNFAELMEGNRERYRTERRF